MKLALIQLTVEDDINYNFEKVVNFLNEAIAKKPDFILLPECFLYISNNPKDTISNSFLINNEFTVYFKKFAKDNKISLLLGSMSINYNNKLYNSSILIDTNGNIISEYKKIHMFDVKLSDNEYYNESETYSSGNSINLVNYNNVILGHSICYDLRFPKLYRLLAKKGAQIILAPSAFTKKTGEAHWHVLVRARAIENGVFIIAPNQWGTNKNNRSTYGHSLVVSPWGEIIADGTIGEKVIFCEINLKDAKKAQESIPSINHDINFENNDEEYKIIIK